MRLSIPCLIIGWLNCYVPALASTETGNVPSAASVASGAAEAAKLNTKAADIENKLDKTVGEMLMQSNEKVKSLKGMLTTNSKAIAALTGLFKEVSRMTGAIGEYEAQLRKCKEEVAQVKTQQATGPESGEFHSAENDPLASFSFYQTKAEKALVHAASVFSKIHKNQTGISLLQRHHSHHRRGGSEEQDMEEEADEGRTASHSQTSASSDAIAFSLSTIGVGEEEMDSRIQSIHRSDDAVPGMDPLEYGMYDFTGTHGVKIFDRDSMNPDVQHQRELATVNRLTREGKVSDEDDDEDDD